MVQCDGHSQSIVLRNMAHLVDLVRSSLFNYYSNVRPHNARNVLTRLIHYMQVLYIISHPVPLSPSLLVSFLYACPISRAVWFTIITRMWLWWLQRHFDYSNIPSSLPNSFWLGRKNYRSV